MSEQEQDVLIGEFVRQHGERHKQFVTLAAKLIRIGGVLQGIGTDLLQLSPSGDEASIGSAKNKLSPQMSSIDFEDVGKSLKEYLSLGDELIRDASTLREYGLK